MERARKLSKRISAWLLTFVMAASLVTLPAKTAEAADVSVDLSVDTSSYSATSATFGENPDTPEEIMAELRFSIPSDYASKGATGYSTLNLEVNVTVNGFTSSSGITAGLYAMNSAWGDWKDTYSDTITTTGQTVTLSLPLTGLTSFGALGLRFTGGTSGTNITYTINSAKLVGTIGSSSSSDEDISSGSTSDEVTAVINKLSGNYDWAEYNYSITNNTDSPISGIQIKIPTDSGDSLQAWGCSATYSDGYIIISHTAVLAAGATYTADSVTKFGVSHVNTFGTPIVEFVYGEDGGGTSSSELKYELTGQTKTVAAADTPVGKHGQLSLATVSGYSAPIIVDKNGEPFQLRGASTHGMHWSEMTPYVNKGAFQSLRDEWGVNMVRLVSYVTQGGYTQGSQSTLDSAIQTGVAAATELGMYAIIDWHIHAENPWGTESSAEAFFTKYAQMYANNNNVIYEICNEPTGVTWYNGSGTDLYSYCKKIATIIRQYDNDALIVCGTNNWSQDVDEVAAKPLKDDGFTNILYTFHFYSGSHYDDMMNKVKTATAAGTPIFVTEFGICDASGNGGYDTANADKWIALCDQYNISYACWSLCNKNESASYLLPGCTKTTGGWTASDLSTTGIWLVNTYRAHQDKENGTDTKINGGQSNPGDSTGGSSGSGTGDVSGGSSGSGTGDVSGGGSGNVSGGNGTTGSSDSTVSTASLKTKVSGVKLTAGKRKLTLKWKKKTGISGYQIQISTSKKFKKKTTYKVSAKTTKKALTKYSGKKLLAKKKYYVRIRAYVKTKNANGKSVVKYSKWTTVSKKTK